MVMTSLASLQVAVAPSCNTVASTDGFEIRIWRPSATDTGDTPTITSACVFVTLGHAAAANAWINTAVQAIACSHSDIATI
jgi:hypothetical protein